MVHSIWNESEGERRECGEHRIPNAEHIERLAPNKRRQKSRNRGLHIRIQAKNIEQRLNKQKKKKRIVHKKKCETNILDSTLGTWHQINIIVIYEVII